MQTLKRIRYYTMNSWNRSTAPAYNLKVRNVIDRDLQDKVFEIMDTEEIWYDVNDLIHDFDRETDYEYQVAFNGRSGGYLVIIKGGCKDSNYKSYCPECGQWNYKTIEETGNNVCGRCNEHARINRTTKQFFTQPGINIEDDEVPAEVLKSFRKLAIDIVKLFENTAKNCNVIEKVVSVPKTIKILECSK